MSDQFQDSDMFDMPATEEQQPCSPSFLKLPDPRNSNDLDHLVAKLEIASFAEQALFRERHTLRTSIHTQALHIDYLKRARETLATELETLTLRHDDAVAHRDEAAQQFAKLKAAHSSLVTRHKHMQAEIQRVRAEHADVQRQNGTLSKSKAHLDRALMTYRSTSKQLQAQNEKLDKAVAEASKKVTSLQGQIESWRNVTKAALNELGISVKNKDVLGKNQAAYEVRLLKDACLKWKSDFETLDARQVDTEPASNESSAQTKVVTRSDSEPAPRRTRNSLGSRSVMPTKSPQKARSDNSEWKAKYEQIVKQMEIDAMKNGSQVANLTRTVNKLRGESNRWKQELTAALTSHDKERQKKDGAESEDLKKTIKKLEDDRDEWRKKYEEVAHNSPTAHPDECVTPEQQIERRTGTLLSPAPLQKDGLDIASESPSRLTDKLPFAAEDEMEVVKVNDGDEDEEVNEDEEVQIVESVNSGTPGNDATVASGSRTRKSPRKISANGLGQPTAGRGRKPSQTPPSNSKTTPGRRSTPRVARQQIQLLVGKRTREGAPSVARPAKVRRTVGRPRKEVSVQSVTKSAVESTPTKAPMESRKANPLSLSRSTPGRRVSTRKNPVKSSVEPENAGKVKANAGNNQDAAERSKVPASKRTTLVAAAAKRNATVTVRVTRSSEGSIERGAEGTSRRTSSGKQAGGDSRGGARRTRESTSEAESATKTIVNDPALSGRTRRGSTGVKSKGGSVDNENGPNERSLRPRRSVSYNYDQEGRDVVEAEQAMSLHRGGTASVSGVQTPIAGGAKGRRLSSRNGGSGMKSSEGNVATRVSTRRSSGTGSNK